MPIVGKLMLCGRRTALDTAVAPLQSLKFPAATAGVIPNFIPEASPEIARRKELAAGLVWDMERSLRVTEAKFTQ